MIEVIKNNYKPLFPKIVVCSKCGSILKVKDENDIDLKYGGEVLIKCPCCGEYEVAFREISGVKNGVFIDSPNPTSQTDTSSEITHTDKKNMLDKD